MKKNKKDPYKRVRNPILKQAATKAKIKVRLDSRTIITLPDMSALKLWKEKYPNATVISNQAN
jgi:hypothetical protein